MTLRTGKLHKPCKVCEKYFEPRTNQNRVCYKCYMKIMGEIHKQRIKKLKVYKQ